MAGVPVRSGGPDGAGRLADTAAGSTFVRTIGNGAPVLVVHGGPGFSHGYLVAALTPLAARRRLIFFDQPGCGLTPAPPGGVTADHTFRHAAAMLRFAAEGGEVGVIAHSWGALAIVAAAALEAKLPAVNEGVLINPVAVRRREWDAASQRLIAEIAPPVLGEFTRLLGEGKGAAAMQLALPYYTRRGFCVDTTEFPLEANTYLAVTDSLGAFDFTAGLGIVARLTAMIAAEDFTGRDLAGAVADSCRQVAEIAGGHFPFFEAPGDFTRLLLRAFGGSPRG